MDKEFVFISDFDGTITKKDFYRHVLEKYLGEEGEMRYKRWRSGEFKDVEFLGYVFQNIGQNEEQIHEDIIELEFDPYLKSFIDYVHENNGDFIILSAGSNYYIEKLLKQHGIEDISIYSNKGVYRDKGIHFDLDPTYEFYSERYGINKKKVVEHFKSKYKRVYYAGDSSPDYEAGLLSDLVFAKCKLVSLYKENNITFAPFDNFSEIKEYIDDIL